MLRRFFGQTGTETETEAAPGEPLKLTLSPESPAGAAAEPEARPAMREVAIELPNGQTKFAVYYENVFSAEECAEFIRETEADGYVPALINVGGGLQKFLPAVRSGFRVIRDDVDMTARIWERIRHVVPQEWPGIGPSAGLNERLRFLRYDRGQDFESHYDGAYVRDEGQGERAGEKSAVTVLIYLNEEFEGGSTRFVDTTDRNSERGVDVNITTGGMLIFQHDILHKGMALLSGRKYALRTDVMYAPPMADRFFPAAPSKTLYRADDGSQRTVEEQNAREVEAALEWHRLRERSD